MSRGLWSRLTEQAKPERQRLATDAVDAQLADAKLGLVRCLTPPLVHAQPRAVHIQVNPPGVCERGGRCAHAGVWALMAASQLGLCELGNRYSRNTPFCRFTYPNPAPRAA